LTNSLIAHPGPTRPHPRFCSSASHSLSSRPDRLPSCSCDSTTRAFCCILPFSTSTTEVPVVADLASGAWGYQRRLASTAQRRGQRQAAVRSVGLRAALSSYAETRSSQSRCGGLLVYACELPLLHIHGQQLATAFFLLSVEKRMPVGATTAFSDLGDIRVAERLQVRLNLCLQRLQLADRGLL
jgi:hypothetical protein